MNLLSALAQLDLTDDAHWTADGAPRLDVLSTFVGTQVTRAQLRAAAPLFTRSSPSIPGAAEAPEKPAETVASVVTPAVEPEPALEAPVKALSPELQRLKEVDAEIDALNAKKGEIENALTKLAIEQQHLQRFAPTHEYDHKADQEARMAYLAAQQKHAHSRAAKAKELAAQLSASSAPIDRAMARRMVRGGARPSFPRAGGGA